MSISRDPNLQALFAQAEQDFQGDSFADDVMRQVDRERRKTLLVWSAVSIFVLTCLAFLATPAFTAARLATEFLPVSLVEIETEWLRLLLSPVNSVAAVIALSVLGIRKFFRRIFR